MKFLCALVALLLAKISSGAEPPKEGLYVKVPVSHRKKRQIVNWERGKITLKCNYPLEIYFIQDTRYKHKDGIENMKRSQLPRMFKALDDRPVDIAYGTMSFQGRAGNCFEFKSPLSRNTTMLVQAYDRMSPSKDPERPNNAPLVALRAALQSEIPGWGLVKDSVKLIVLITSRVLKLEHLDNDQKTITDSDRRCDSKSPIDIDRITDHIATHQMYLASLIQERDAMQGWQMLNARIGQTPDFVQSISHDSSGFWERLEQVLTAIDKLECNVTMPMAHIQVEAQASAVQGKSLNEGGFSVVIHVPERPTRLFVDMETDPKKADKH